MWATTRPTCAGVPSPSSSASYPYHPPPPSPSLRFGGSPSSASYRYRHPPPDRFDFILAACGCISPSQDALLRSSPFIRQEAALPTDIRVLTGRILYRVFGSLSPHPSKPVHRYSDAAAAELALVEYFLRLGPRRLHLLHQRQPLEGEQARRIPCPAGPPEAAKERPEGMPPPAEAHPSCRLDDAAVIPTTSSEAANEKGAALKRGRPDSSYPPRFPSSTGDERSKKPCVRPNAANPTGGICSADAGVISTGHMRAMAGRPPLADYGGRGSRKLPPSILCPVNWEEGGVGDEGGTHVPHRPPQLQVEQEAGGKASAAAHAPRVSSPVGQSFPAENVRTVSSADATDVEEQGLDRGDVDEPRSPSLTALVEESLPSRVGSDAISPSKTGSDAISLSTFIDALLKFSKSPIQIPEDVDLLEALATKGIQLPHPKWWRPGGYGCPSSLGDK